jgi:GH24 family phage-related lysozyme (muramidase)
MKQPSEAALNLIFEYEVGGGEAYYNKYLTHPTWPGGHSGLTLGIGIDCGYYTQNELANLFNFLLANQLAIIQNASGKVGENGRTYVRSSAVKNANITITWDQAVKLFNQLTWPKYARLTDLAFPGADQLKDNAYGALVSLVFNRGSSLKGDSRTEMRSIRDLVPKKDYAGIANELRKMKRIWEGKGLDGLIARREAEAKLVETCI